MDDLVLATQSAAFYAAHSGQSRLVLNHIEPHYKDKVGSVPSDRHLVRKSSADELGVSNLTRGRPCCMKESKGELCGAKEKMNSIAESSSLERVRLEKISVQEVGARTSLRFRMKQ